MKKEEIVVSCSTTILDNYKTRINNMSIFLLEFIGRLEKAFNVTEPLEYKNLDCYDDGDIFIKTSSLVAIRLRPSPYRISISFCSSPPQIFPSRLDINTMDLTYSISSRYGVRIFHEIIPVVEDTIESVKKYRNEEL